MGGMGAGFVVPFAWSGVRLSISTKARLCGSVTSVLSRGPYRVRDLGLPIGLNQTLSILTWKDRSFTYTSLFYGPSTIDRFDRIAHIHYLAGFGGEVAFGKDHACFTLSSHGLRTILDAGPAPWKAFSGVDCELQCGRNQVLQVPDSWTIPPMIFSYLGRHSTPGESEH